VSGSGADPREAERLGPGPPIEPTGLRRALGLATMDFGPLLGNVESGVVASLAGLRAAIVSCGVLCIAGVAVAALTLPAFWRYDARV
jgi:hypothetical protein